MSYQPLNSDPVVFQTILSHGDSLMECGDLHGAQREYIRAASLCPESPLVNYKLAKVLLGQGLVANAAEYGKRALSIEKTKENLDLIGEIYLHPDAAFCFRLKRSLLDEGLLNPENYSPSSINLDSFRVEAKKADERYYFAESNGFKVAVSPDTDYPFSIFSAERPGNEIFSEHLQWSHLALAKMVTEYTFDSVLDIGSANGTSARLFRYLGKDITTIEILDKYESDYSGDYLDIDFKKRFDAVWCSHVLEHQRHPGRFLEKIFNDLKPGGVLGLSVPSAISPLIIGHCNIYTPLLLLYNLILSGFDCSYAKVKCYDWQISVILQKKSNNLSPLSFASIHMADCSKDIGFVRDLISFFPEAIRPRFTKDGHIWGEIDSINWVHKH